MNWIHSRTRAEQKAAPTKTVCRRLCRVSFNMFEFWSGCFWVNEVIYSYCFSFLCKYIYLFLMWSEPLDCKCVYRMFGRNVLQIGMYLSGNMGGSHFFIYLGCYVILFICLFVDLLLICVGWKPHLFTYFVLLVCSPFSSGRRSVHAAILKKPSPIFRCQTPKPVIDASMPKVMYIVWTTFVFLRLFWSVFVTRSVLALSERAAAQNPEKRWPWSRLISSKKAVFYTDLWAVPFSMQYNTKRETVSWSLYWDKNVDWRLYIYI